MYAIGVDVTLTDTVPRFKPGTVACNMTSGGMKKYKYVKYNNGQAVTAVAGNVVYYHAASGASAGETIEVTMDLSDSAGLGAGVLQAVIADGSYGWIQITGPATLTTALTAGADGNALTAVGATDGTLDVSALVTDAIVAFAVDASAKIVLCCFPE
jgi:hypothetical protein